MEKKLTKQQIEDVAKKYGFEYKALNAFRIVESGGIGFASDTGKIIIQFEPAWFKRKSPYTPSGKWSQNGVERQSKEWEAFTDAFKLNPNAAMESTSIGMFQVMGFHYKSLGFGTVGEMWDFAKESEFNQLLLAVRFIKNNPNLERALKARDWAKVAYYYNGSNYKVNDYDNKLQRAYQNS